MGEIAKIQAFEYLLSKLLEWNSKCYLTGDNDLSILKVLKLTFFVSAVGTNKDSQNSLLDSVFNNFVAMPYGHVESDIYSFIKANRLPNFTINNSQTIKIHNVDYKDLDYTIKSKIDKSVAMLQDINSGLIKLSSFDLVDLSHNWYSWQKYFSEAQSRGINSLPIPTYEIKREDKIYQL